MISARKFDSEAGRTRQSTFSARSVTELPELSVKLKRFFRKTIEWHAWFAAESFEKVDHSKTVAHGNVALQHDAQRHVRKAKISGNLF